jgi:hypothetical protein
MTVAAPCKHRWQIAEPKGEKALGICKICGMTKWFETSYGYQYRREAR